MMGEYQDPLGDDDGTRRPGGETILAGRYRVIRSLGEGAMGKVLLAVDMVSADLEVAIKVPAVLLSQDDAAVRKLQEEALLARRLSHENIVTLRTIERDAGGVFLVMDYVPGETLQKLLGRRGPLPEEEVVAIFTPLARALDYAHREKVIHRDVKPSNILIRKKDGRPLLADFGIAREMKESLTRLTGKSSSGTLPYMSPEQLNGEAPSPAQDVYSFAATMYECLAGHPPFHRGEIAHQIERKDPAPLPGPPSALKRSILRGLSKDPGHRPGSCAALVRGDEPEVEKRPEGGRRPVGVILALLLLLAGGAVALVATRNGEPAQQRPSDPPPVVAKSPPREPERPEQQKPPPPPVFEGTLTVSHPEDAVTYTKESLLVVAGTLTDCSKGWVWINGDRYLPTVDGDFKVRLPLSEGETRIEISAEDQAGTRHDPLVFRVIHDLTDPTIEITAPAEGTVTEGTTIAVSGKATDPYLEEVRVGDEAVTLTAEGGFETDLKLTEGTNRIEVSATDRAGNSGTQARTVECDTQKPVLEVEQPAEGALTGNRELTVSGTVRDATLEVLTVEKKAVQATGGRFETKVQLTEGRNEIEVVASDRAGHTTGVKRTVTLDTTKPTIELDAIPGTVKTNSLRVTGKVNEDGCTVRVCDRDTPVRNGRFDQTVSFSKDGAYEIKVTATDRAGNVATETRTVTVRTAPDLGSGYQYRPETLTAFQSLVSGSEWSKGNPLRTGTGTKGMLRATHRRTGLNFVVVPAGPFQRGSTDGDSDEQPVRTVTFSRAFLICETECTQGAWKAVMGSGNNPSSFTGDDRRPVEQVSWDDARTWLGKAGGNLRLPSEAEWEYACRSGSAGKWCFGDDENQLGRYAEYEGNNNKETKPVAGKLPNAWGLFDLQGNVWEWCEDWYGPYSDRECPNDGTARTTQGGTSSRVNRGGSWLNTAWSCRSAFRSGYSPGLRSRSLGFRPARSLP